MKKFFATVLAAAAMSFGASAQYIINFDDYTAVPEVGTEVSEISSISVTFPNIYELELVSSESIILYDADFEEISTKSTVSGKVLTVSTISPLTTPGSAYLVIAEGALCGWAAGDADFLDLPEDINLQWTITGSSEEGDFNFDATVDPAEGTVESLKTITVTFPNIEDIDISAKDDITFSFNGSPVDGVAYRNTDADENKIIVTLPQEMTAGGEYELAFPPLTLTGYNYSFDPFDKDNTETISFKWTIEGNAEDVNVIASPANGSSLAELSKVTLNFGSATSCSANLDDIVVTVGPDTLTASTDYKLENADDAAEIYLVFTPALSAEQETTVGITFPAGSLSSTTGDAATAVSQSDLELRYTLLPAVKEDLTLTLTSATKLSDEGTINLEEKQITAFFFVADMAGLDVASTTAKNVVVKSEQSEFDYDAEASLSKGYGFDASKTYFSAEFGKEPTYNGNYSVTVAANSFGDATWLENHAIGHTNPEIVINFTIVGGKTVGVEVLEVVNTVPADADIHNLQGQRVNTRFESLPAGIYIINGRKVVKK